MTTTVRTLAIASIPLDRGTQVRAEIHQEAVQSYAESMRAGAVFPPCVVYYDGETYWPADGHQRLAAAQLAGLTELSCEIKQGTQRDALLDAVGRNATHGLQRTSADKRRAVELLLRDEEWGQRSDRWIAEACAVSPTFVGAVRAQVSTVDTSSSASRTGKDGKVYTPVASMANRQKSACERLSRLIAPGLDTHQWCKAVILEHMAENLSTKVARQLIAFVPSEKPTLAEQEENLRYYGCSTEYGEESETMT